MPLRLDQLPPKLRKQVADAGGPKRPRDRKGASTVHIDGTCHDCGAPFTHEKRWEEHSDSTGHRRLDMIGGRRDG
jgi:hypothetical protein